MLRALFICLALLLSLPAGAQAVNYTTGNRLSVSQQNADLAFMKASGVKMIRFPLENNASDNYAGSIALAQLALTYGIQTFYVISLQDAALYPNGQTCRAGDGGSIFCAFALSAIQPGPAANLLGSKLGQARFAFAELGNEINNPAFNGDITNANGNIVLGLTGSDSETTTIKSGFTNYVTLAKAINQFTTGNLVSAGLYVASGVVIGASTGTTFDAVDLNATLTFLKNNGMDPAVNFYGVHSYPGGTPGGTDWNGLIQQTIQQCGVIHPCIYSEWGIAPGPTRLARFQTWLSAINSAGTAVAHSIYFDWKGGTFGLVQGGLLSVDSSTVLQGEH